jgi:virginiamycin B lyase
MRAVSLVAPLLFVAMLLAACETADAPVTPPPTPTPEETPVVTGVQPTPIVAAPEPTPEPTPLPFEPEMEIYEVPAGSAPHDVAPAVDGGVWYTAQHAEALGYLDPATGETRHIHLGAGARPHGVIVGPDGAPWITDGGLNAIVRVDPETDEVEVFTLPTPPANLNTAAFDGRGRLWFTGQAGYYGSLDPATGELEVFDAPRGRGPYGIAATPAGEVYFVSLAGSYLARIDLDTADAIVIQPPDEGQGARRVWSDSLGRLWVSEWNTGQLSMYDPETDAWRAWMLPGGAPQAYSVYVDERDAVWVTDFPGNAIWRFDPKTEEFMEFPKPGQPGNVRQMLGREGEVWAPESATDRILVIRY